MLTAAVVWDAKPETQGEPINWVELKTSSEILTNTDQLVFDKKLMRYWIQSFLLGVPKIIVGFRSRDGILTRIEEFQTMNIPYLVQRRGLAKWDGNVCIKFTSLFLECTIPPPPAKVHSSPPQSTQYAVLTVAT